MLMKYSDAQNQMIVMMNDQNEEAGMGWGESSHEDRVVLYAFNVATPHRRLDILEELISVLAHFQGRL